MPLPSKSDMDELREHAGDDEHKKGVALMRKGGVRQVMLFNDSARGIVMEAGGSYTAYARWSGGMETDCSCDDAKPCRHAIALAQQVAKHPEMCLEATWIEEGVYSLTEAEAKRLLLRSLQLDPALWGRLNAPIAEKEGGMRRRVAAAWAEEKDAAGAVWRLERLLEDARQWCLPPGGRARMDLALETAASVLAACENGIADVATEATELLQDISYVLCEEMERVGDAAAFDGLRRAVVLLEKDRFGLGLYGIVLPFALALGSGSVLAVVAPLLLADRVPAAAGRREEWATTFKDAAQRLAASTWPGGDRGEGVDEAERTLAALAEEGLPSKKDVETAQEVIALLPTWMIAPHLETMRRDRRSRGRWFRVLCTRDAGLAISFLQQGPADLEVDMVISLMLSLPKEGATSLGAEWAEMRLNSDATKITEIAQVLAHVHSLLSEEEWNELKGKMLARAMDAEKVAAALTAAEESRV